MTGLADLLETPTLRSKKKLSEFRNKFIADSLGRLTLPAIAKELGISRKSVQSRMKEMGLSSRTAREKRQAEIRERFAEFCDYYGYDTDEVSRAMRLRQKPGLRAENERKD
jgi:hypothetical protein